MDSIIVAANFSLNTGGLAKPANHLQVAANGVLPQQQQLSLAEHVNDSSSYVSVVSLQIMGT
jgi:hypothetical protein